MKIAFFSENFYPELSGVADSILTLGKELAGLGHQICFCVPRYSEKNFLKVGKEAAEPDLGENIKILRFFSLPFPSATGQSRAVIPTGLKYLKLKRFNPDLIHSHLFFGLGLEAILTAKRLKKPLIGTNHTNFNGIIKHGSFGGERLERLANRYVSWYYNHCDYVTSPSKSVLREMKSCGFGRPSEVISNPIDLKNFFPAATEEKGRLKKEFFLSASTVIYAGRLAAEKRLEVLLRAIALVKKEIPDVNLAIVGHGEPRASLEELAGELGLERSVKFLGTVDKITLNKLYQAAEIFAIASPAESQCLSMMQAMAAGLPVVGVRAGGLDEYIDADNGFKAEPGDFRALAEKIILLLENPQLALKLGEGGRKLAGNFSAEVVARQWEKLYQHILKPKIYET